MNQMGRHVVLDAYLAEMPSDAAVLAACEAAIAASGMHVECAVRKDFRPAGLTAVWVLSESHFTVHTYPEHAYLSVDCYTCGTEGNPDAAIDKLVELLAPVRSARSSMARGSSDQAA